MIEVIKPKDGARWSMVFTCDGCHDKLSLAMVNWRHCLDQAKAKGWRVKRVYDEWKHGCPTCSEYQDKKFGMVQVASAPDRPEETRAVLEPRTYYVHNPNLSLQLRIAQITGGRGRLVMPDYSKLAV